MQQILQQKTIAKEIRFWSNGYICLTYDYVFTEIKAHNDQMFVRDDNECDSCTNMNTYEFILQIYRK